MTDPTGTAILIFLKCRDYVIEQGKVGEFSNSKFDIFRSISKSQIICYLLVVKKLLWANINDY